MSPIRIALVGLSTSAKTSWAADAHLPYLLSERGRSKYSIVALCNSSKAAAESAIKTFNLPANEIKAYGSSEELAADPDIDLVVITTRVDVHYDTIKPSLEAGKAAFVEWPLAENAKRASELAELARAKNVRTMVGTQARVSPTILKVKELLASGAIGQVLSSDVHSYHSREMRKGLPEGLAYFTDQKVGGNIVTIAFGHMIDFVHSVLGEYSSSTSASQLQRPTIPILGKNNNPEKELASNVPDVVLLHGHLTSSSTVRPGATLSVSFRRDPAPFPDEPGFTWSIYGSKGQLRVTVNNGPFLHSESGEGTIQLCDHERREIETVPAPPEEWKQGLPLRALNVASMYEAFAAGEEVQSFDGAVVRHRQLERIFDEFNRQQAAETTA